MTNYYDKELYHHGVRGQKWGVIRKVASKGTASAMKKVANKPIENGLTKKENKLVTKARNNYANASLNWHNARLYTSFDSKAANTSLKIARRSAKKGDRYVNKLMKSANFRNKYIVDLNTTTSNVENANNWTDTSRFLVYKPK